MSEVKSICRKCGLELSGESGLCIRCYARIHKPCPDCMRQTVGGGWRPRLDSKTKRPKNCQTCDNQRYLLIED